MVSSSAARRASASRSAKTSQTALRDPTPRARSSTTWPGTAKTFRLSRMRAICLSSCMLPSGNPFPVAHEVFGSERYVLGRQGRGYVRGRLRHGQVGDPSGDVEVVVDVAVLTL